jgi:hypothetical protein
MVDQEISRKDMRGFGGYDQFGVDPSAALAGHIEPRITRNQVVGAVLAVSLALTGCGGGGIDKDRQAIINRNNELSQPTPQPGPGLLGGMETAQAVQTAQEADRQGIMPTPTVTSIPGGWIAIP